MCARLWNCEITETTGTSHGAVNSRETVCAGILRTSGYSSTHEDEGNCTVRSSKICILRHYYYDKIKDDVMGWTMKYAWVRSKIHKKFRQETLGEKLLRKPTHTSKDNIKMAFKYCVDCFITIRKWSGGEGIRITNIWDAMSRSATDISGEKYRLYPADGGGMFRRNDGQFLSV
jgi:hypothetical protein